MNWISLIVGTLLGGIIGFSSSTLLSLIQRRWAQRDRQERARKLLSAVVNEVKTAVSRVDTFVELVSEGKISFGRIYTGLWDSTMIELATHVDDLDILRTLHWFYYKFDLINFNLDRGGEHILTAHGFAQSSICKMRKELPILISFVE